jgi:hypothetical protein
MRAWRLHDGVLYKNRHYLYYGAGPAIVLFAPWCISTGHDLPENFALVLCFGAYLFLSGALLTVLRQADAMPGPGVLSLMLLLLPVGTGVPYLLIRTAAYETAIAGAFFGVAGGRFCLVRGLGALRPFAWYVTS